MPSLLVIALIGVIAAWAVYQVRLHRAANVVYQRLKAEGALLLYSASSASSRLCIVGRRPARRRAAVVALTAEGLIIYPRKLAMDETYTLPFAGLRWFGRPQAYHSGRNDIWLHFEQDGHWQRLELRLPRAAMGDFVRMLKEFAPELIPAYRRRRPYVHFGPAAARPADEDIHGAWTLDDPVTLYVTPLAVVVLRGDQVKDVLPLDKVHQVAAMRRIDQPHADGLVTFTAAGERFAFASRRYQALAHAVAEAARRNLEQPLVQKRKGKLDDDEDA
jgi:hypothetical protein